MADVGCLLEIQRKDNAAIEAAEREALTATLQAIVTVTKGNRIKSALIECSLLGYTDGSMGSASFALTADSANTFSAEDYPDYLFALERFAKKVAKLLEEKYTGRYRVKVDTGEV